MMKKNVLFKLALIGFVVLFTACEPESENNTDVITFEDVSLGTEGYWNGSDRKGTVEAFENWGAIDSVYTGSFTTSYLQLSNTFVYNAEWMSASWSGFACSSLTNMDSVGYNNQYSVYAKSGANGSKNFALLYTSDSATCSFEAPVSVKSLMINNSTYVYKAIKEGKDGYKNETKFDADDYLFVTVTGYDEFGKKTNSVEIPLADFRMNKTYVCSSWTKASLASLGTVKSLSFRMTTSDMGAFGSNTPMYCCIDNIEYLKD